MLYLFLLHFFFPWSGRKQVPGSQVAGFQATFPVSLCASQIRYGGSPEPLFTACAPLLPPSVICTVVPAS